ncbi:MAG TPA: phosphoglycerate kinase [Desulfobacterales bacterium]
MNKLTVEDLELQGRRVLMRVDFNVPLQDGRVADDGRIRAALPTIRHILEKNGKLVLMSHLGRPKGSRVPEMSLQPCTDVLDDLLQAETAFAPDCVGEEAEAASQRLAEGQLLLLENLRFHAGETENDPEFAGQLARLGDVYVNDAFGTAHRAHASTEGVTRHFKQCAAGFLMMKEIEFLGRVVEKPEKPYVAVLGGAKISGKIDVISNLLPKVEKILIGGGMMYTFLKARGLEIGNSLLEADRLEMAANILEAAGGKIVLPEDCVVSDRFDFKNRQVGELQTVSAGAIPADAYGMDIGERTVERFRAELQDAQTVAWNGPMGVFEIDATAKGTFAIARILADITEKGATTVIGGGDSAAAVRKAGVQDRVSHVSTGGGASLEFMEGKTLPGISALTDKP